MSTWPRVPSGSVDVDGAALVDQQRGHARGARLLEHELRNQRVAGERAALVAPRVEDPVNAGQLARLVVDDERGADVAHPEVVERRLDNFDLGAQ